MNIYKMLYAHKGLKKTLIIYLIISKKMMFLSFFKKFLFLLLLNQLISATLVCI